MGSAASPAISDQQPSAPPLRVWITGASGLIGHALLKSAPPGWQVFGTTREQIDLTDARATRTAFLTLRPDAIIHCAALTKTAVCHVRPAEARTVNVEMTARLAELACDISFLLFSTDLVFDGRMGHYRETDDINPLSVYGETKAEAEQLVLRNPKHAVIRTSLNGGISPSGDRGFNEELRRVWGMGLTAQLFTDEFRCPIAACITAQAVWELVGQRHTGLYHLAGAERLSRWQIGRLLAQRWPALNPRLEPASRLSYTGPPRPADTSLDCTKVQRLLSFSVPGFSSWLASKASDRF